MAHLVARPPACLFSLTHPARWVDPYATGAGEERLILSPYEITARGRRDDRYARWMSSFPGVRPPRKHLFQAVRVLRFKYAESGKRDWWEHFQDAALRVYVQPLTAFDDKLQQHIQFYMLCYEDAELVNRFFLEKAGTMIEPRNPITETHVSDDKRLRKMRVIPVECCQHERHNTTAGKLPDLL